MDTRMAECRPGWLLNLYHIRHAIQTGLTTLDFLRGDESYKARLAAVARPQERWRAAAGRPWAQVRYGAYWAGVTARHWWSASPASLATENP
jgi:CelD/BcsL family acetyltransferase involved in cellulose biosynthesis